MYEGSDNSLQLGNVTMYLDAHSPQACTWLPRLPSAASTRPRATSGRWALRWARNIFLSDKFVGSKRRRSPQRTSFVIFTRMRLRRRIRVKITKEVRWGERRRLLPTNLSERKMFRAQRNAQRPDVALGRVLAALGSLGSHVHAWGEWASKYMVTFPSWRELSLPSYIV